MNKYDTFIFDSYEFDESSGTIKLHYSLDHEVSFTETIKLPEGEQFPILKPQCDEALFMLHLIGGMSYYKTCLPKNIEVHSGSLNAEQAKFWNDVYENGLGEFFYKNKIESKGLIHFPVSDKDPASFAVHTEPAAEFGTERASRLLVPIGGGKDSLVTIELLKKSGIQQTLLRVGAHPFITKMAHTARQPLMTVGRNLSPALFDLNAEGALNGHVPITAYLSVLSVVLAELYGYSHIVFSNERSANEGNTVLDGKEINHQWSKSLEFEKALRTYVATYVSKNIEYFSLLRPLSELHIVQLFAQYPQYFESFTSCNSNWKILKDKSTQRWCSHCPKCAFAFAMLAAFVDKPTLLKIFDGKNLFEDEKLIPTYRELLGIEGIKPFECVGTPKETYAALMLASDKDEFADTPLMNMFEKEGMDLFKNPEVIVEEALTPSPEHCIPETFQSLIPQ